MRDETGQVFVLAAIVMVVMIGMVGFAVDVGHAYLVQRQLQAGVDAAALAGAQELPDSAAVTAAANAYSPSPTQKNALTQNDNAATTVTLKCVTTAPGCSSAFNTHNAVQVDGVSNVRTYFARVLGIDSLTVHATATACAPCSAKPLDIMVVLDRTGSMCDVSSNGQCRDLTNAVNGIKTFLGFMDPALDEVGLAVFPPAVDTSAAAKCATPTSGGKRYGYDTWWPSWVTAPRGESPGVYAIGSPVFDYLTRTSSGWQLNPASSIVQLLNCVKAAGTTSYANAIDEAQHELDVHGRGNVQDVIIILTDGAANTTPRFVPSYLDNASDRARPCGSGIKAANHVKGTGTIVYTIGYDVDADSNGGQCGAEGFNASWALQQMATVDPSDGKPNYYNQPNPAQLNTIFTKIAADISRPSSRLIG
jgi:Flp pilus assembly protein TadG